MPVKHAFQSPVADNNTAGEVGPSEWNDVHPSPPFVVTLLAQHGGVTWTNMPAALTEWNGSTRTRTKIDLTHVNLVRLTAAVATPGVAGAEVRVQHSTDQVNWSYLDGSSGATALDGPGIDIGVDNCSASTWRALTAGAKADVFVRLVGINGNGAADPVVGLITLQLN